MMKRFSITELLKCSFFEPEDWFRKYAEYGKYKHEEIQEFFKNKYMDKVEIEYPVSYIFDIDGVDVEVVGRIDIVRIDEPIFYEIKPMTKRIILEYSLQMWFYEFALRRQTKRYYEGRFIFYNRDTGKWFVVKPLLHNDNFIDYLISIIKWRLEYNEPVRGGLCRFCKLRNNCNARFSFHKYNGIVKNRF